MYTNYYYYFFLDKAAPKKLLLNPFRGLDELESEAVEIFI